MLADRFEPITQTEATNPFPVEWIAPSLLIPHPRQSAIYGEEDVTDLVEDIRASQWIKPLITTQQDVIISGHRRWKAACVLNWRVVPVERRPFERSVDEIAALLLENRYREKTATQRVREGKMWEDVEKAKARQRMSEGAKRQQGGQGWQNFATPEKGMSHPQFFWTLS